MRNWLRRLFGFHPDEHEGKWGVYHPFAHHLWDYPFDTHAEAVKACDILNQRLCDGTYSDNPYTGKDSL